MTSLDTAQQATRQGASRASGGQPMRVINIAQFRNQDGTYDGVAALASLTGLSYAEVAWSAQRIKHLLTTTNLSRQEVVKQVRKEAESKPWIK